MVKVTRKPMQWRGCTTGEDDAGNDAIARRGRDAVLPKARMEKLALMDGNEVVPRRIRY